MKLTTVLFTLALFGSTLSAQETSFNPCPFFGPELQKVLVLDRSQCERISLIHQESWPALQPFDERLRVLTDQTNYLSWTEDMPAEEVARKMSEVIIERRKVLDEMRRIEREKNRKVLGVLNQKQRLVIDQLTAMAPAVRLFNEATAGGLIPFDIVYPVGSSVKGSSNRPRQ